MTRETKLGLLIGTGIILLIGIVVSDHLTVVQKHDAPPAAGYADTSSNVPTPGTTPGITPTTGNTSVPGNGATTPAGEGLTSLTGDPVPAFSLTDNRSSMGLSRGMTPGNPGTAINLFDPAPPSNDPLPQGNVTTPGITPGVTSGRTDAGAILHVVKSSETLWDIAKKYYSDGNKWQTVADANKSQLARGLHEGMKLTIPSLARTATTDTTKISDTTSGGTSGGNTGGTITVAQGDTLAKLAAKHLGSANKWQELLKANSDKIKKAEQLKIGMVLRLPETKADTKTDAPKATDNTTITSVGNAGKTYTVVAGDSLYIVAKKTLGNANRWKEILEANKDTLKGKTNLAVGQKLNIPNHAPPVRDQVSTPATPVTSTIGSATPTTAVPTSGDGMTLLLDDAAGTSSAPAPAARPVL